MISDNDKGRWIFQSDFKNLEEACDEIDLLDEDERIPYLVGEVFIYQNIVTTQNSLEEAKKNTENEINDLKQQLDKTKELMSELKVHLYGKFGSHINLEAEEE